MSKAWIFDFDGTLVHSETLITQCFQRITKQLAPQRVKIAQKILIGPPLRQTVAEILGSPEHPLIDDFISAFIQLHDDRVLTHTKPYPYANDTLKKLYRQGIKMAIATNKRVAPTQKIINHFGWEKFFIQVECSDSTPSLRSKNEMISTIISKDSDFKGSYFVGDTVNDGLSANDNSLPFIKASFGYGRKQDWSQIKILLSVDDFKAIETFIVNHGG